jgi:hypothetical protein
VCAVGGCQGGGSRHGGAGIAAVSNDTRFAYERMPYCVNVLCTSVLEQQFMRETSKSQRP